MPSNRYAFVNGRRIAARGRRCDGVCRRQLRSRPRRRNGRMPTGQEGGWGRERAAIRARTGAHPLQGVQKSEHGRCGASGQPAPNASPLIPRLMAPTAATTAVNQRAQPRARRAR
eukprot:366571-Chlamydomonas_euryale.AAC.20